MIIFKFFMLWAIIGGLFSALLFGYKSISKSDVIGTAKIVVASVVSFALAMFIFIMET